MNRETKTAIDVRNVSKEFPLGRNSREKLTVLDRVSFSVQRGEFIGVIGPNGCGKSTLLKVLLGILPAETGEVTILGKNPSQTRVGYVPQLSAGSLFPWWTSLENVAFASDSVNGVQFDSATKKLREFGMEQYQQAYPYQLSGGMNQLVSLARATQCSSVFLLDEPLTGLDYQNRLLLEKKLLQMRDGQHTVLMVSHDIESTILLCDKLLVLSQKPTRVKALLPVPLPSVRTHKTRFLPEFSRILDEVYSLIQG